ncbi:MAG: heavy metal-responsive transcriptional regulator [Xanthobacteraceae bacterium]|nr:heavy metal-responsive transcriptional regulator [Xanthobacteraceae bacterium]
MLTIGKLAGLTNVSNDTLRYYEREGLIEPAAKSAAGYRLYDKDSARRIHFIKHAQQCGFTLSEVRELLVLRRREKACCGDIRSRAIEKKLQIEHKICAMKAMSAALDQLIAECDNEAQPVRECTIIAALERAGLATPVQ